ncbi:MULTISPECIES: hypothetical protein [unclassified Aeromicrobium]|uniref:hypothetical protein n=1 Tax=unclassified Aeromicrobium TaxID=2633570 RepID=UPI00396B258F
MTLDDEDPFGDHVPERAPKAAGKAAIRQQGGYHHQDGTKPIRAAWRKRVCRCIEFDVLGRASWIRFCSINLRLLQHDDPFKNWDVVTVDCVPAMQDGRVESWKPVIATMETEPHLRCRAGLLGAARTGLRFC